VRPSRDGRVELVGRITLGDWEQLAGTAQAPAQAERPHSAPAAAAANAVTIPDTPAGRLARRYVEAFNSGEPPKARDFIQRSLVPSTTRSTEERMAAWAMAFHDLGPLVVTGVRSSSENEIVLDVRARGRHFRLTAKRSADHPDRAASITIGTTHGGHP
jgi:hypothetical protein